MSGAWRIHLVETFEGAEAYQLLLDDSPVTPYSFSARDLAQLIQAIDEGIYNTRRMRRDRSSG